MQQDFRTNKIYGASKYDIGLTDASPSGMLSAMPVSILAGIYRPFVWEALSPTLFLNGLESLFFMYLTALFFFKGNLRKKIQKIRQHEFLIFALFFMLMMAFMAGFTGVLFGVLVRFKAPALPFLVILLTSSIAQKNDKHI